MSVDKFVSESAKTPHSFDAMKGRRLVVLGTGAITKDVICAFSRIPDTEVTIGRRAEEGLNADAEEIRKACDIGDRLHLKTVDAKDDTSVREFVQFAAESMSGIDSALFGVGGFPPGANLDQNQGIDGLNCAAMLGQLDSDLIGGVRFAQALEPHLRASVEQTGQQARVAFIGSIGPDCGDSSYGYNLAKRGTLQLMEMLADHWAPWCGVNAVSPGVIPSKLNFERMSEASPRGRGAVKFTIAGRYGQTIDVAQAFLYILNPDNAWTMGANIIVDGGITVSRKYGGPHADEMLA